MTIRCNDITLLLTSKRDKANRVRVDKRNPGLYPFNPGGHSISNHESGNDITTWPNKSSGGIFYGWVILATAVLVSIVGFGFYYSFGVFLQDLQNDFGASRAEISLIASILIFTCNSMGLIWGWVADKYGPRFVIGMGGILVFAGLILGSRASEVWQLYVSVGFLVGCGLSTSFVPYLATLVRWFVKLRGLVQGIRAAGIGVGMMVMAPMSARLLTNYGWRTSFVVIGILCLIAFSIGSLLVRKSPGDKGFLPYGVTRSGDREVYVGRDPATSSTRDYSLREAMKTRDLWLLCGVMLTLLLTVFMVGAHLVSYAKDTGMSPVSAATLMTIVGATSIVGKIGMGYLADRAGSKRIIASCAAVLLILMLWLSTPMSPWMFRVFAAVYGLAYGGAFPILQVIIAERFGVVHIAKIMGFTAIGGAVGGVVGPWMAGYIFDTTSSYSLAFVFAAAASLLAVVLILLFGRRDKQLTVT